MGLAKTRSTWYYEYRQTLRVREEPMEDILQNFKRSVKLLKYFGFTDFDTRKKPTRYMAKKLSKLIIEHASLIKHPDKFVKRRVSKDTKEAWVKQGYLANKNYLIIPKQGYDHIHVTKHKMTRANAEKSETSYPETGLDLYQRAHKLLSRPLGPFEFVTARIGSFSWTRQRFRSVADLLKYLQTWQPDTPFGMDATDYKNDLISQVHVVRFFDIKFADRTASREPNKPKAKNTKKSLLRR